MRKIWVLISLSFLFEELRDSPSFLRFEFQRRNLSNIFVSGVNKWVSISSNPFSVEKNERPPPVLNLKFQFFERTRAQKYFNQGGQKYFKSEGFKSRLGPHLPFFRFN